MHVCLQCEMFTACTHNTTMTAFRCAFFHNTELIAVLVETLWCPKCRKQIYWNNKERSTEYTEGLFSKNKL